MTRHEVLINKLREINQATSRELWNMGTYYKPSRRPTGDLIFPKRSDEDEEPDGNKKRQTKSKRKSDLIRISEQEA
ncbi:MAG: hypothetical protein J7M12_05165, partial [Candidatus Hydrogenedentes bacterium]|nr:hypothetical protein [Candidatus Hydrogenedentota bacterium]